VSFFGGNQPDDSHALRDLLPNLPEAPRQDGQNGFQKLTDNRCWGKTINLKPCAKFRPIVSKLLSMSRGGFGRDVATWSWLIISCALARAKAEKGILRS
jgi:hypothetical protein